MKIQPKKQQRNGGKNIEKENYINRAYNHFNIRADTAGNIVSKPARGRDV